MRDFYDRFSSKLEIAEKEMRDVKTEAIETDEVCDKCGSKMVIKWGKFGRFMACSAYPECSNTREIPKVSSLEESEQTATQRKLQCEKCGKPMVLKRGRFGEFMACSGYPECRNTKKIVKSAQEMTVKQDIPLDEDCPSCGKKLAIKHGRFGEFTACSDYPTCKYIKLKSTGVRCGKEGCSGRNRGKEIAPGKDLLRLLQLPRLRFRALEQAVARSLPPVRRAFHPDENHQAVRHRPLLQ